MMEDRNILNKPKITVKITSEELEMINGKNENLYQFIKDYLHRQMERFAGRRIYKNKEGSV